MKTAKLPNTDSIKKLARFWDSHDLADFEDQLEDVSEPIFQRRPVISLKLRSRDARALHKIALKRGIADEDVIREWVLEKLRAG